MMPQQLILPINKCKLTASYKIDAYKNKFGFTHYGTDMVSTVGAVSIYASGDGEVVAAGNDSVVGNVVAVKYTQAKNHVTGKVQDVVFRYFHLASIAVKKGDKVTKDKFLGNYGNTGSLSMTAHLHIEADTDTENPLFSPTVKSSSLLKGMALGANDKSMSNPLEWLYLKTSTPESQSYTTTADAYIRAEDKTVPAADEPAQTTELDRLRTENVKLQQDVINLSTRISALEIKLKQINQLSA